jgi:hypothetical protein
MPDAIFWALIGSGVTAAVGLLAIYIAQRNGLLMFTIAKKEHDLNLRKAVPIIGSVVTLEARQLLNANYRPSHFVLTAIHNYGDLAAQQLSGNWRMYSPDKCFKECIVPIQRDALGPTPYQTEEILVGPNIDAAIQERSHKITVHVDIEFDYLGISPDQPEHYSAKYQYDHSNNRMIKR